MVFPRLIIFKCLHILLDRQLILWCHLAELTFFPAGVQFLGENKQSLFLSGFDFSCIILDLRENLPAFIITGLYNFII